MLEGFHDTFPGKELRNETPKNVGTRQAIKTFQLVKLFQLVKVLHIKRDLPTLRPCANTKTCKQQWRIKGHEYLMVNRSAVLHTQT